LERRPGPVGHDPHLRVRLPTLLLVVLAATAALTGCGSSSKQKAAPPSQHFHTRPDLKPAVIQVTRRVGDTAPGYLFLAPKKNVAQSGPLILDDDGEVVWFHPVRPGAADFRVQHYRGKPVLTWWQGRSTKGVGSGRYEIYDSSYRRIAEVRAGHGLAGDEHEFLLTPRGTALITIYQKVPQDLSAVGGPGNGFALDSILQEVDVATGHVVFEWHSLGNVALNESYLAKVPKDASTPYDYFHINSIEPGPNDTLIVCARHTRAVYEISKRTGQIVWRLGGKKSDFQMGPGARFAWQHDARLHPDGTLTIFDDEAAPAVGKRSRAIVLRLDTKKKTARLVKAYVHPDGLLASSQGNMQVLPDGHVLVGWGSEPYVTEFSHSGQVVFDAHFNKGADSYRAYRFPWVGHPTDRPAIFAKREKNGDTTVYASWNGATEVRRWAVLGGPDASHLSRVAVAARTGFETRIQVKKQVRTVAVQALDASGRVLGTSPTRSP
jgi:hypothetical protein